MRSVSIDHTLRLCTAFALVAAVGCSDGPTDVPDTPEIASITISEGPATLDAVGSTAQFTATVRDDRGGTVTTASITWGSSDVGAVHVSATGLATAVANGSATLTATTGVFSDDVLVTVAQVAASVDVTSPADTLRVPGETVQLTAAVLDANGVPVVGASGTWSSSDESVVTVDANGVVTAVDQGSAMVTLDEGDASGSATLVVEYDLVATTVEVQLDHQTIFARGGLIGTAIVRNQSGLELTGVTVSWSTSDPALTVQDVQLDTLGRSRAVLHSTTSLGTYTVSATTPEPVVGSADVDVVSAPPSQGRSIDFETLPTGAATCPGACSFGDEMAAWGIRFRFSAFTGGGDGKPTLYQYAAGKTLTNDRRSTFEYLTGSFELYLFVDVAEFQFRFWGVLGPVTVYDANDNEVPGAVVDVAGDVHTIHSPVLIGHVKLGPSNGRLFLDDIVY